MGQSQLLAIAQVTLAAFVAATATPRLVAQGPVYRERWSYLHLEQRRDEVRRGLASASQAQREAAQRALLAPDDGMPCKPVARALAALAGRTADDAFVLRSAVGAFVLPEVSDPAAERAECRSTNVSMFLPAPLPIPGKLEFELVVRDGKGTERWRHRVNGDLPLADLRMARATASVPSGTFGDGRYEVEIRTCIDGKEPQADDPVLRWPFHVLTGYQARAEAAMPKAKELAASLPPVARAHLVGAAGLVGRAYVGEAFAVRSEAVVDLERLERLLTTLAAGETPTLARGQQAPLAIPLDGDNTLAVVLRRADAEGPRPLLVIAAGTPAYDLTGLRPNAPTSRDPAWLAHEFAPLAETQPWHIAYVESPGNTSDYGKALAAGIARLGDLVPVRGLPVLACEREAATIAALRLPSLGGALAGLVCVGGGAIPGPMIDRLGGLPVRLARVAELPANESLQRTVDYAAKVAPGAQAADVHWLDDQSPVWPWALVQRAELIGAFAATCFAR